MNNISIMAVGTNYKYYIHRNFVCSLYGTGYQGDAYIFTNHRDRPETAGLKGNFFDIESYIPKTIDIHIQNYRFKMFQDFLEQTDIDGEYILFTDYRDLIFQKNINLYPLGDADIYLFAEDQIFDRCGFNGPNMEKIKKDLYPDINYGQESIICCGTIIVKKDKAIDFLKNYYKYIRQALDYLNPHEKRTIYSDQTMLNYMYYTDNIGLTTKVLTNKDNLVNTMGYAVKPEINTAKVNKQGYIVNVNDEVSYMGHQYDRLDHASLQNMFQKFPFMRTGGVIL